MRTLMDFSAASPSGMIGSGSGAPRESASESESESEKMKFTSLANSTFFYLHEKTLEASRTAAEGARFLTLPANLSDKVFDDFTLDDGLYGIKVNGEFGFGTRVPYWEIADVQHPFIALQHIGRLNGVYIVDTTDLSRGRRAFINLYYSPYTRQSVHPLRLDVVPYNKAPLPDDWQTLPAFINACMYIEFHTLYRQMLEEDDMTQDEEDAINTFCANLDAQEEPEEMDDEFDEEMMAEMAEMEQEMEEEMARCEDS